MNFGSLTFWSLDINSSNINTGTDSYPQEVVEEVRGVLRSILQLDDLATSFESDTRLLGEIPEMDSMAVVSILTEFEERFGFEVMDDEISADSFETFGALLAFVNGKLTEG